MKRIHIPAIAIAFSALFAGQAMAADVAPMTRAQVQAELAEAVRTGNLIVGELAQKQKDISPGMYPAEQRISTVTRAAVKAELAQAVQAGDMIVDENGRTLKEIFPENYASQEYVAGKSRAEVRSELAEAAINGQLYQPVGA